MQKSVEALEGAFNKIRTGRAHPSILEGVRVDYYGSLTPLSQVANVSVEDARMLAVTPWEKQMVPEIEKAIMKSDLGLNPVTAGVLFVFLCQHSQRKLERVILSRRARKLKVPRVSARNIRRDVIADIKELQKAKDISEDQERKAQDEIQKITDKYIAKMDEVLKIKESRSFRDLIINQ